MIRTEDLEFQNHVFSDGCCIALPMEISVGGSLDITVYPMFSSVAEEFEEKFALTPFSDDAVRFLTDKISPALAEFGFGGGAHKIYRDYRMTESCPEPRVQCEILSSLEGEACDIPSFDEFELDGSDPLDRMAVVRRDGVIVCYAAVNDISEDDGCVEITVECDREYRRMGFASACAAALSNCLVSLGEEVKYYCAEENTASVHTAEKAGFTLKKRVLPLVYYRNDDED